MSLELDARQRAMLQDMGITVWLPKPAPAPLPQATPLPAQRQKASLPAVTLPPPAAISTPHQWHAPVALYPQANANPEGGSCWLVLLESNTSQQPLSGDVGQLLDNMLRAMRLHRHSRVFAASLAASGTQALAQVLENAQPHIILALGRAAAHAVLESTAPLGTLRQTSHRLVTGTPVVVSYDPAYLLRALPETKAAAWADLCLALEITCANATIAG